MYDVDSHLGLLIISNTLSFLFCCSSWGLVRCVGQAVTTSNSFLFLQNGENPPSNENDRNRAMEMGKNASSMQAITDWPRRNSRDPGKTSPD